MESDTLYGDLMGAGADSGRVKILQEQLEELQALVDKKDKDISDLQIQNKSLLDEKNVLESNMVSLFNTAILEVQRKDKEIAELRRSVVSLTSAAARKPADQFDDQDRHRYTKASHADTFDKSI